MSDPGWYPDTRNAGIQRYWDGQQWTEHVAPLHQPVQQVVVSQPARGGKTGPSLRRRRLSKAGGQTAAGLACPRCGSSQFTAKRSKKGKVIGVVTVGVGVLLAPKSQVKCVACGTMYRRG